jgi:hypothetical protein
MGQDLIHFGPTFPHLRFRQGGTWKNIVQVAYMNQVISGALN